MGNTLSDMVSQGELKSGIQLDEHVAFPVLTKGVSTNIEYGQSTQNSIILDHRQRDQSSRWLPLPLDARMRSLLHLRVEAIYEVPTTQPNSY